MILGLSDLGMVEGIARNGPEKQTTGTASTPSSLKTNPSLTPLTYCNFQPAGRVNCRRFSKHMQQTSTKKAKNSKPRKHFGIERMLNAKNHPEKPASVDFHLAKSRFRRHATPDLSEREIKFPINPPHLADEF